MGKKIFGAGIVALLGGLTLRFLGVIELSLVIFLVGAISCVAGAVVGLVNVIRHRKRREKREKREKRERRRVRIRVAPWIWLMLASVALALLTGEGNFLALSLLVLLVALTVMLARKIRERFGDALSLVHDIDAGWGIAEVKIIGGSTEYQRGGLGGALIGGMLGGGIGAAVGAVTRNGKAVQKQRFAVKYQNGRTGTEEHRVGSLRYNELMRYVKWEEI